MKKEAAFGIAGLVALFLLVWFALRTALRGELGVWGWPVLLAFFAAAAWMWMRKRRLGKK